MPGIASLLCGAIAGLALGMFGAGGSVLVMPTLVYGLSMAPSEAARISQMVVGASCWGVIAVHRPVGRIHWPVVLILAASGAVGAILGRIASRVTPDAVTMTSLALVLIAVATLMLRKTEFHHDPSVGQTPTSAETTQISFQVVWITLSGFGVGFLTGFMGVGGGFILVPVLVTLLRMPITLATGVSLAIIGLNCTTSVLYEGVADVPWQRVWPFLVATVCCALFGRRLATLIAPRTSQRGFALFALVVGLAILLQVA